MERKEIIKFLEDLDFTRGESSVYITLLSIGESKVGPIIKKSEISRSKVYDILERLIKKGIVSKIKKNNILFYQALSPEILFDYLKIKEEKIRNDEINLKNILPKLIEMLPDREIDIIIYEGVEGFKRVINRTINELNKDDVYEAMGISKTNKFMTEYALKIYQKQKIKKFKARSIFDEYGAYKIKERKTKWHEIKILPRGWHTPALFTVYRDTTGIHLGNENKIISLVIKSDEIAQSFRTTFEAMWKVSR